MTLKLTGVPLRHSSSQHNTYSGIVAALHQWPSISSDLCNRITCILFLQTWINKYSRTKCTKSRTFNYLIIFINSLRLSRWQSGGGGGGGLGSYDGSQGGKKISSPVCPAEHLKEMWPASLCGVLYYYSTHWITSPSERQCRDRAEKWRASSVLAWPPLQGRSCVNNHPVNTAWLQLELQTGLRDSFSLLKALHP